jgi:hypothetical protein
MDIIEECYKCIQKGVFFTSPTISFQKQITVVLPLSTVLLFMVSVTHETMNLWFKNIKWKITKTNLSFKLCAVLGNMVSSPAVPLGM